METMMEFAAKENIRSILAGVLPGKLEMYGIRITERDRLIDECTNCWMGWLEKTINSLEEETNEELTMDQLFGNKNKNFILGLLLRYYISEVALGLAVNARTKKDT